MVDIIFTYYNNPDHLYRYIEYLNSSVLNEELLNNVIFTFVDDYSDEDKKAIDVFNKFELKINVKLFSILEDKGYNTGGARNVGCINASTNILASFDLDMIITNDNLSEIINLKHTITDNICYKFRSCVPVKTFNYKKGKWVHLNHRSSFIISKKLFCDGNFFDEDFSGQWGYEDFYFFRVLEHKQIPIIPTKSLLFLDRSATTPNIDRSKEQIKKYGHRLTEKMYNEKRKTKHLPVNPLRFKYELTYTSVL